MAHAFARRCGHTGDKADDGLFHVELAPAGGFGLVGSADFANHDDGVGIGVVVKGAHHVDVLEAIDGVATNTNCRRLAQTDFGQLRHGFIGERA